MTTGVYLIRHKASKRTYIGSSRAIPVRWKAHQASLDRGFHHSPFLQNAWNKYGAEAFEFLIVEQCPVEDLLEREQFYMDILKPKFNAATKASGGSGSKSDAQKLHQSQAVKESWKRGDFKGRSFPSPKTAQLNELEYDRLMVKSMNIAHRRRILATTN